MTFISIPAKFEAIASKIFEVQGDQKNMPIDNF